VTAAKRSRILEREDALAFWLLFPTLALLGLLDRTAPASHQRCTVPARIL
jgi:hypothetical protein